MSLRASIVAGLLALVVILGLCCGGLWLWKQRDNARAERDASQLVVTAKQSEVDDLKKINADQAAYNKINNAVITQFFAKVDGINGRFNTFTDTLNELRRKNADVEKYLSQPIPPSLAALLNGVCDKADACNERH